MHVKSKRIALAVSLALASTLGLGTAANAWLLSTGDITVSPMVGVCQAQGTGTSHQTNVGNSAENHAEAGQNNVGQTQGQAHACQRLLNFEHSPLLNNLLQGSTFLKDIQAVVSALNINALGKQLAGGALMF